jgi:mono/diheme cytochrome c family protein
MKLTSRAPSRAVRSAKWLLVGAFASVATFASAAAMSPAQKLIQDGYAREAKAASPSFAGFSADRGKALFQGKHSGGKAATPSCTTCHTTDPRNKGETRAGKAIEPMAGSANPKRFTNQADVEKWFRRNCSDVLGRTCTAVEKGDVMAYLLGQ